MAEDATRNGEAAKFEDRPQKPDALPPELKSPLAPFEGARPPAPEWFEAALAQEPERELVPTPRGRIEALSWGARGEPGLLFVHGNTAHADWWSFLAPLFAEDYRVTAMSLAGMGESDWRDAYSFDDFADDAEAVAQATGLHEGGRKAVYVAHSFGGGQSFYVASRRPEQLHAAILIDVGFRGPMEEIVEARLKRMAEIKAMPIEKRPTRTYPTLAAALARFRLSPPQPAANLFIVDHLGRHGLRQVETPEGGQAWSWKFDPDMWDKLDRELMTEFFAGRPEVKVPLAHIYGEKSALRSIPGIADAYPADGLLVGVPEAHHHLMVDQPLALVSAIRSLLAAWRA